MVESEFYFPGSRRLPLKVALTISSLHWSFSSAADNILTVTGSGKNKEAKEQNTFLECNLLRSFIYLKMAVQGRRWVVALCGNVGFFFSF